MPRVALNLVLAFSLAVLPTGPLATDPHIDPGVVTDGCRACHRGHGVSRSPMLPAPQVEVCLTCHGSEAGGRRVTASSTVGTTRGPETLSSVLAQPFVHPIDDKAYSRHEPGAITCTSCHSPHRGADSAVRETSQPGQPKPSSRNPSRLEYELCESCHGRAGRASKRSKSVGELLDPRNRSYHPVKARSRNAAPSVSTPLAGGEVNCTDCHGNSDRAGPRGPHGSSVSSILVAEYVRVDGSGESATAYALCYTCHDRDSVLNSRLFPEHRLHIVDGRTACATCHDAHGSVNNRALIRFGEEEALSTVAPSGLAGQLGFVSDSPGSGACYLTCHGYDHAPAVYGVPDPGVQERLFQQPDPLRSRPGEQDTPRL
jgi:predicted CXXCH cytochrome family protein